MNDLLFKIIEEQWQTVNLFLKKFSFSSTILATIAGKWTL
ncbi:hypothetical protein SB48_HM08orf05058 [Heyndrickxia coagulans]|uniref:Uncharacterized protein n=1 Tax=Heyndrickxia coagulans TaxID=1398 RepID=A0AAN0WCZ0_HEYCO|nr:hypothetical protein SB48_HM08orf05058 [Heyndrickxia coagulans]KYC66833.1 hypothetical protein B4100_0517 [Heyndrickxia coagulans]